MDQPLMEASGAATATTVTVATVTIAIAETPVSTGIYWKQHSSEIERGDLKSTFTSAEGMRWGHTLIAVA